MVWNYRGYGLTHAKSWKYEHLNYPSPEHIEQDSVAILDYLRNQIGVKGRIGVYGRSLGGIAATHLSKYVDLIIADRSFGNLYDVAETKFYGKVATSLFHFGTGGFRGNSDHSLIE